MAKILKEKFPSQKVVYIDVYIDVYRFVRKAVPPEQQPPQYKVLQSEHKEFILKVYKEAFDKAAKNKCEYVPYAINVVGNMLKKEFPDSTSLHANKSIQQFVHRCLPLEQRPRKNRFLTLAQKKFIADVCRQSSNSINAKEMIKIMQDVFEDFDFGERTIRRYLNYEKKWIS
jgi:hypothetical protein